MALKLCRMCGVPTRLSRGYEWPGNGTIVSRRDPTMRMVIFEAGFFPYAWKELEERLRVPVADAMIRRQQAWTWDYMQSNITFGWRKHALRYLPVIPVINLVISDLAALGLGRVDVAEYRRGRLLVLKVHNPFDIISVIWGAKGVLRFVEGKGSETAWNREGDVYTVTAAIRPGLDGDEEVDAEALESMRAAKYELSLAGRAQPPSGSEVERCRACGLPAALGRLEWRPEEGIILQRESGKRFVFTSGHVFIGVVRELERQAGRGLEEVILEIAKYYHLSLLKGLPPRDRADAYGELSEDLRAFGFGEVVGLDHGEGYLEMRVANPFYPPRLAGRVAATFEHVEEIGSEVEYSSPSPGLLEIAVRTA